MFQTKDVMLKVKAAKLVESEDSKGNPVKMAEVQLVRETFPIHLARELGEEVASHLWTEDDAIRHELDSITLDPRIPNQRLAIRAVPDMPATELQHVEVGKMTFARQEDDKTGEEWIRATIRIRFDLAPKVHREWLIMHFGEVALFSGELEQLDLIDRANPVKEFVETMREGLSDGVDSVELSMIDPATGRRTGTRITKDTIESI
jgi:hypothetical protein